MRPLKQSIHQRHHGSVLLVSMIFLLVFSALEDIQNESYQMETLDENGNPLDINGNPLGPNYEDRYYSSDDEIQAYHEGINYGQADKDMPGMDISDYNTNGYLSGLTNIPSCPSGSREVKQPSNSRTSTRSSSFRVIHQENNRQLTAIESNGRVYLENTIGVEVCENDDDDEGKIKTIE